MPTLAQLQVGDPATGAAGAARRRDARRGDAARQHDHEGLSATTTRRPHAAFAHGWYHSGDLAVWHPDGYIEIKDRSKDIIISGGENISSLEVEECLYRHPQVMEAAVVARPDEKWGETPCAFVTLKPGARERRRRATSSPGAASTSRTSRRRRPSCSARCRRPRPARSRNSCCASGARAARRSAMTHVRRPICLQEGRARHRRVERPRPPFRATARARTAREWWSPRAAPTSSRRSWSRSPPPAARRTRSRSTSATRRAVDAAIAPSRGRAARHPRQQRRRRAHQAGARLTERRRVAQRRRHQPRRRVSRRARGAAQAMAGREARRRDRQHRLDPRLARRRSRCRRTSPPRPG